MFLIMRKKNMSHPAFIIGALSFLCLLIGVFINAQNQAAGKDILIAAAVLGFVHWVWSIVDVFTNPNLDGRSRVFWRTLVIIVAPIGGMVYYMMKHKVVRM
jgi:hypothetical protein